LRSRSRATPTKSGELVTTTPTLSGAASRLMIYALDFCRPDS